MRCLASLLVALLGVAGGCSGQDEAVGDDGRGPDVCANYQDALCDWVVRCNPGVQYADCQATASSIVCAEGGRAETCAAAIDLANCAEPPDDCELFDVADRGPARAACEQYKGAVCSFRVGCDIQSDSECQQQLMAALDCADVVGVRSEFPSCLEDLAASACDAAPPASCDGVLVSEPQLPSE